MSAKRQHGPRDARNEIATLLRASLSSLKERRIGIEIERIGMWSDGNAFQYQSQRSPSGQLRPGAGELLSELNRRYHWPLVTNDKNEPLGMTSPLGKVSLEPGSQLELSTETRTDLFTLKNEIRDFEGKVEAVTDPWDLKWLGIGVNPCQSVDAIDLIPSTRYHIMTDYLGRQGKLATSMMRLTSSVQINLDYNSEEEGIEMLRVALAAAPLSYALFANSPFSLGSVTDTLSFRNTIWRDTDPKRTGLLPEVFSEDFDFGDYADLVWGRPLMFAQRTDGNYVAAEGASLSDIADGKLPGVLIDASNLMNGVRELFTEARLKPGYLEVRSIDGQDIRQRYACVAFWMGLLYDASARTKVMQTLAFITPQERETLLFQACQKGLKASVGSQTLQDLAKDLLPAIKSGLKMRGFGEEDLLQPVEHTVHEGLNPAQRLLKGFEGPWHKNFAKVIEATAQVSGSH